MGVWHAALVQPAGSRPDVEISERPRDANACTCSPQGAPSSALRTLTAISFLPERSKPCNRGSDSTVASLGGSGGGEGGTGGAGGGSGDGDGGTSGLGWAGVDAFSDGGNGGGDGGGGDGVGSDGGSGDGGAVGGGANRGGGGGGGAGPM